MIGRAADAAGRRGGGHLSPGGCRKQGEPAGGRSGAAALRGGTSGGLASDLQGGDPFGREHAFERRAAECCLDGGAQGASGRAIVPKQAGDDPVAVGDVALGEPVEDAQGTGRAELRHQVGQVGTQGTTHQRRGDGVAVGVGGGVEDLAELR